MVKIFQKSGPQSIPSFVKALPSDEEGRSKRNYLIK
jgi:hypothetical protein